MNKIPYTNKIKCGDNLELFKELPNNSIDFIITSPPYYKQRDYGSGIGNEKTINEYVDNLIKVFNECIRVIKDTGNIIFNIGDKYQNSNLLLVPYRFALKALEENKKVKLVNNTTWVKANPTPRQFQRRLVSSTEPFFHFVKSNKYYYDIKSFLNETNSIPKKKNGNNVGQGYFKLINTSNLSPENKEKAYTELYKVINEVKGGKISEFRMKIKGIHSEPFGGQEGGRKTQLEKNGFTIIKINGNKLKKDIINSPVETLKATKHPAIYPEFIIKEFLKLLTRENDIVLDPFMGSGTTAVAAIKLNRKYVGFELNNDYCDYAEERIKNTLNEININKVNLNIQIL